MASHATGLDAVHEHPGDVFTEIVPPPPVLVSRTGFGVTVNEQAPPACVILNVAPPTVIVADRTVGVLLAAAEYTTDPFPLPLAPLVIVNQLSLLVAFHVQLPPADTAIVPDPAAAAIERVVGESVTVHDAPVCVTLNRLPPIASVAVRDEVLELADTL